MKKVKSSDIGELEKNLIQSIPGRENEDLSVLDEVDKEFEKYLNDQERADFKDDFDQHKYIAESLHDFIKKDREFHYEDVGIFHHDEKKYSLFDVCKNLLESDGTLGNCLGLSQLGASLLSRRGVPVEVQKTKGHIRLGVRSDGESYPVDLSSEYDLVDESDTRGYSSHSLDSLIASIHKNLGSKYTKEKKFDEAVQAYSNLIDLEGGKEMFGYQYRAKANLELGNLKEVLKDYEKLSEFEDYYENLNFQKAKVFLRQGKLMKAGKEYVVGRKREKDLKFERDMYKFFGS